METGGRSLKEAVDSAFEVYARNCDDHLYAIGSVVGPHPFPSMVRDFQTVIGREARAQLLAARGALPAAVVACVGGGSNAMSAFTAFLDDADVRLIGVEPAGRGQQRGEHAMSIAKGADAVLHGMRTKVLVDDQGEPDAVHSIASGLDYPGVGPQHAYFDQVGRVEYVGITDDQVLDAFIRLSRTEGIIPALESAHAVAHAMVMAPTMSRDSYLMVNLSGRGDKDVDHVAEQLGMGGEPDTVADAPAASLNV